MKKSLLKKIGYIFLGILVVVFVISKTSIIGNVIFVGDDVLISDIGDISVKKNELKSLRLSVENLKDENLENCGLIVIGNAKPWTYVTDIKDVGANEKKDFELKIKVPKKVEVKSYKSKLELNCNNETYSRNFIISVVEGNLEYLNIDRIEIKGSLINVSYSFDNNNFIGDSISVQIWLEKEGNETKRVIDIFKINREGLIKQSTLINAGELGGYELYLALSSDTSNYLKRNVIVGRNSITGRVSFEFKEGQGLPYFLFLIIMLLGVYFIYMRHKKGVRALEESVKP